MSCGTRAPDFRPGDPDGAWLLRSSLWDQSLTYCGYCCSAYCSVACDSATLRQPAPSPVLRLLWRRTPLPNFPVRAPAADAFTEVLLTDFTAGYCQLHLLVLLTAAPDHCGHPVRSSVPSPSCNNPGFGTPPPHRPANCGYCWPAVRLCQALLSLWATRETITTPALNVYSGQHRFSRVRRCSNRPRPRTAVEARAVAVTAGLRGRRPGGSTRRADRTGH